MSTESYYNIKPSPFQGKLGLERIDTPAVVRYTAVPVTYKDNVQLIDAEHPVDLRQDRGVDFDQFLSSLAPEGPGKQVDQLASPEAPDFNETQATLAEVTARLAERLTNRDFRNYEIARTEADIISHETDRNFVRSRQASASSVLSVMGGNIPRSTSGFF